MISRALESRLLRRPDGVAPIDYANYAGGIEAPAGSEIASSFTISPARSVAGELRSGALPIRLLPISSSRVPTE